MPNPCAGRIDRDAEAAVALVLERLDFAEAHRDREARGYADAGLGRRRAAGAREGDRPLDDGLECLLVGLGGGHGSCELYRRPGGL